MSLALINELEKNVNRVLKLQNLWHKTYMNINEDTYYYIYAYRYCVSYISFTFILPLT